jgi:nicotinamide riboside transporter PnuC
MTINLSRLGREPALLTAFVSLLAQAGTVVFMDLTPDMQGAVNAVAAAIAGIITAWGVAADKMLPFVLGLVQALLALGIAWGLQLTPEEQATVMGFVALVAGMFVRTQVWARVELVATGRHSRVELG